MLKIKSEAERPKSEWLTVREGKPAVRMLLRPVGPVVRAVARQYAQEQLQRRPDAGLVTSAETGFAYSVGLIAAGIEAWEGIGDASGEPVDPTPDLVAALLADDDNEDIFNVLEAQYVYPSLKMDKEKNASARSPTGGGVSAERNTVGTARAGAKPARKSSTGRKPSKGARLGNSSSPAKDRSGRGSAERTR